MSHRRTISGAVFVALTATLASPRAATAGPDWDPVPPELLGETAPRIDPDADAEAVFWRTRIRDSLTGGTTRNTREHSVRVKVFTKAGAESQGRVDITPGADVHVGRVAARTVQPDGTVVPLAEDAVFQRVLAETSETEAKGTSFVLPAVEPGSILDHRWTETRPGEHASYLTLDYSHPIPVRESEFSVKPLSLPGLSMRAKTFNGNAELVQEGGYTRLTMTDVAAFVTEPAMPPWRDVAPWTLIYYHLASDAPNAGYWRRTGRNLDSRSSSCVKVTKTIREEAARAVAEAGDRKLVHLAERARRLIRPRSGTSWSALDEPDPWELDHRSTKKALKAGEGDRTDVSLFTRRLERSATTLPKERCGELEDFLGKVAGAESAPVVLVKR